MFNLGYNSHHRQLCGCIIDGKEVTFGQNSHYNDNRLTLNWIDIGIGMPSLGCRDCFGYGSGLCSNYFKRKIKKGAYDFSEIQKMVNY